MTSAKKDKTYYGDLGVPRTATSAYNAKLFKEDKKSHLEAILNSFKTGDAAIATIMQTLHPSFYAPLVERLKGYQYELKQVDPALLFSMLQKPMGEDALPSLLDALQALAIYYPHLLQAKYDVQGINSLLTKTGNERDPFFEASKNIVKTVITLERVSLNGLFEYGLQGSDPMAITISSSGQISAKRVIVDEGIEGDEDFEEEEDNIFNGPIT